MTAELLVVVPTRGRPARFQEFLDSWTATSTGEARLLACLDVDDPDLEHYPKIPEGIGCYSTGPREGFAPRLSHEALAVATLAQHSPHPFAIASFGDDHLPRTRGWDRLLLEAARDLGTGVVYPNDLLQREALPTAVVLTSDIVRALGWFSPPCLAHVYVDNFWRALGIRIERLRYLPDVVVEHMHPNAAVPGGLDWERKAPMDQTYLEASENAAVVADLEAWEAYRAGPEFDADVARVLEVRK